MKVCVAHPSAPRILELLLLVAMVGLAAPANAHFLCSYFEKEPYLTAELMTGRTFDPASPSGFGADDEPGIDLDALVASRRLRQPSKAVILIQMSRGPVNWEDRWTWLKGPAFNGRPTEYRYQTLYTDPAYGSAQILHVPRRYDDRLGPWGRVMTAEKLGSAVFVDLDTMAVSRFEPRYPKKGERVTIRSLKTPIEWGKFPTLSHDPAHELSEICQ